MPPDYAALARRFGGTTTDAPPDAPVNYDSLAARFGGTTTAPPTPSLGHPLAGMDDAQIAATLGLDYAALSHSQFYHPGALRAHVTTSPLGQKIAASPVGAALQGLGEIAGEGVKWIGKGAHALGAWSDSDLAYADALQKLRDFDYAAASGGEGVASKIAHVVAPLTLPVGEAVGAVLPAAGKAAQIARGVAEGGAFAALQPSGTATLPQKARQIAVGAVTGGAVAPIAVAAARGATTLEQRGAARLAANRAAAQFADEAAARGVPLTAGEAGMTLPGGIRPQEVKRGEEVLERFPVVGLQGFREGQQAGARQMVEQAAAAQRAPLAGANWGQVGTASAQAKARAVKATARTLYGAVRDAAETAGVTVAPTATLDAVRAIQGTEAQRVLQAAQSPALQNVLDDIATYGKENTQKAATPLPASISEADLQWPGLQKPLQPHEIPVEETRSVHPRTGQPEAFTVEADRATNRLPPPSQTGSQRDWLFGAAALAKSEGRDYATTADLARAYEKGQWDRLPRGEKMRHLGLSVPAATPGAATTTPLTFTQAQQLDDDLGRIIDQQYQGGPNATIGKPGAAQLQQIRAALRQDMDTAAKASGRGDLFDAQKKADRFYRQQAVPLKAQILRGVLKPAAGTDPAAAFQTFVRNASKGDAQFLYDRLDPTGRAAVRSGLIDDVLQNATRPRPGGPLPGQSGDFLSPAQFVNGLEQRRAALGVFFRGREAQEWAGIENILRHVPRAGQFLENPSTGNKLADPITWMLLGGGGVGGAMAHSPTAALGGAALAGAEVAGKMGTGAVFRWLTTTPAGRSTLVQASRLRPGSRAMQALLDRVARSGVGAAALTAGSTQR